MATKHCGSCGTRLAPGARFCNGCGASVGMDDTTAEVSLPMTRARAPLVGAVVVGVGVFAGTMFAIGGSEPSVAIVTDSSPTVASAPPIAATPPTGPLFTSTTRPMAEHLFPERVADLVDLERQSERVHELRFRLTSRTMTPELGEDRTEAPRESWAVPLGVVEREGGRYLAVATTRCLVDYSYPERLRRDGRRNLAIFSGEGRTLEVFRIGSPASLVGTRSYDARREALFFTSRGYLEGAAGDRYFGELEIDPSLRASVVLPVGSWDGNDGADMVVVYFPLDDTRVAALEPRRHLGVDDPEGALHDILAPRTDLWNGTFTFSLVSSECMSAIADGAARVEDDGSSTMFLALAAVVAVAVLGPVVIPALGEGLGPAIVGRASLSLSGVLSTVAPIVWRTITRVLAGERLEDVLWNEGGQLVMAFVRGGGVQQIVLAGVSRLGLDDAAAELITETVEHFVAAPGSTMAVMTADGEAAERCDGTSACAGAVVSSDRSIDVAAEILRRGLARLDFSDPAMLAQQITLVRAASEAIADPDTRTPIIDDSEYQRHVRELLTAIGG